MIFNIGFFFYFGNFYLFSKEPPSLSWLKWFRLLAIPEKGGKKLSPQILLFSEDPKTIMKGDFWWSEMFCWLLNKKNSWN